MNIKMIQTVFLNVNSAEIGRTQFSSELRSSELLCKLDGNLLGADSKHEKIKLALRSETFR